MNNPAPYRPLGDSPGYGDPIDPADIQPPFGPVVDLRAQRDALLAQARAKTPGVHITADAPADDADALRAEITALREFIDRPTPGLHTDTYDEDADGPVID